MSIENLFPMATTPFEQYMLADERDGYTMTFRVCVTLAGQLDRSRFESAVREIEDLQPLLQAVIQPLGDSQFQWQYAGPVNWPWPQDAPVPSNPMAVHTPRAPVAETEMLYRLQL